MSSDRFDVVIFGATGYTGKYAIRAAVNVLKNLRWAVAGRNQKKLEQSLQEAGEKVGQDLSKIPIIIADIEDENSLLEMTKQAKVIANCAGPYRFFGEQVVKACIETGTSHVDVSGEPQFMETMQLKYNDAAREKGSYIVSACGFDSIPADMGTIFLKQQFKGTVNCVEVYMHGYAEKGYKPKGAGLHYGTYESAVFGLAHANELRGIRQALFPKRMPRFQPELKERPLMHKQEIVGNRWSLPFPGADRSVVYRTQRYLFEQEKQRPIQMKAYICFESFFQVLGVAFFSVIFGILTRFGFGRRLLLNNPKFFTGGMASHEGPSEENNENALLEVLFLGQGWKEELSEPTDKFETPMNKKMVTRVFCRNPGYGSTTNALLLCAKMILNEKEKLPEKGGVFPPAAAFHKTSLITALQTHGWTFDVVKVEED